MKVGKPVKKTPRIGRRTENEELWQRIVGLKDGLWIPVRCKNKHELRNLQVNALGLRSMRLQTMREGLTLYIRQCSAATPTRERGQSAKGVA